MENHGMDQARSSTCRTAFGRIHHALTAGVVAIGVSLTASTPASAQDGTTLLDGITVIGTRTEVSVQDNPRSVSVVDQQQLERQAPESIAEALSDVPGVELVDAGVPGMKRLVIRGESSRRVTILVDGQEITDHSSYGTPILINPAAVERIDVIRGPASVLYGAKAIGGVINVITKKGAPDKAVELEIGASYYSGSDGRQGWASVSGTIGNFDYRVTGGFAEHEDRRVANSPISNNTSELASTSFENNDISAHIGFKFGANSNHYLSFKAEQYKMESEAWSEDPFSLRFGVRSFEIDLPQRDRKKFGIFYDGHDLGGPIKKVHVDAYYQTIDRLFSNNVASDFPFGGGDIDNFLAVNATSDDRLTNYGGLVQVDLELLPRHLTIFGAQYLADIVDTDKTSSGNINQVFNPFVPFPPFGPPRTITIFDTASFTKASIKTFSIFAQDTWEIVNDLTLTAGVRANFIKNELDRNQRLSFTLAPPSPVEAPGSSDDTEISSSVGLTYTGIQNTTLRALYSSGYISPTLLQLYGRTSAGGTTALGNPNLELETADNYELGFRYDGNGLVIDATAYYMESKDYINLVGCNAAGAPTCSDPGSPFSPNRIFSNIDKAETRGVELLMQYTFPGTTLTPYVTGAYTQRKLFFDDFTTYNSNVPRFAGRFGVRYEWDFMGVNAWADLFARASSKVKETEFSPTANAIITDEVGSWATLNLAFGGTFGEDEKYKFAVQVNNITDEAYRPLVDALPGVERSVEATMRVKF